LPIDRDMYRYTLLEQMPVKGNFTCDVACTCKATSLLGALTMKVAEAKKA